MGLSLNGFPSNQIPEKFRQDPYRFLIVAEKFQSDYDKPLVYTMYVDKPLEKYPLGVVQAQSVVRLSPKIWLKDSTGSAALNICCPCMLVGAWAK